MPSNRDMLVQDVLSEFDTVFYDGELDAFVVFEEAERDDALIRETAVFGTQSRTFTDPQPLLETAKAGSLTSVSARAVENPERVVEQASRQQDSNWTQKDIEYARRAVGSGVAPADVW